MSRDRLKRGMLPPAQQNIEKLEKAVNDDNHYGAQQMYKSISARYISAQRFSEALDILQSGACIQLKHGQITCGTELAVLFVDTLIKGKFPCNNDTLDCVRSIYKKFPQICVPRNFGIDDDMKQLSEDLSAAKLHVDGCSSFLKAAIRWSMEFGVHKSGSPEMYTMLADYIFSESPELDMARVSSYFARGDNPKKFALALVNFMGEQCYPGEDDLAIARAVLMYLSLGNLRDANYLMDELMTQLKSKQLSFPQSELLQFVNYLLQTLQRDALPLFNMLRQNFKLSIEREASFNELLDDIAEKFYGVQRKQPMQGMFGDILKMIGGA